MSNIPDTARRKIVSEMAEKGVPQARATIIVDIAAQACDQAVDAFMRTLRLAPDMGTRFAAMELSAQFTTHQMEKVLRGTDALARSLGDDGSADIRTEVTL